MGPDHALVLVVVDSVPTGATILRADGTEVGEAPLKRPLRLDPDGSISLTARKQGWKTAGPIRKEAISGDELVFSFTLEEGEDAAAEGGRSDRSETSATKGRAGKARSPRSEGDASDRMSRERIAEAGFLIFRATPQALIGWVYNDITWSRFAALAPLVVQCAVEGDTVAQQIIEQAAIDLATAVTAVVQSLGMASEAFPLVLAGGNLRPGLLSDRLCAHLASVVPQASLIQPQIEPALGAALLALQQVRSSI